MRVSLEEGIRQIVASFLDHIHTSIPGKLLTYNAEKQQALIKPLIKQFCVNDQILDLPTIVNVPVILPHNNTCGLKFPLDVGDSVLIIFTEVSLERWLSSLGTEVVEPGYNRRFDLSDAVAIPCLFPLNTNYFSRGDDDKLILKFNSGKITLSRSGGITIANNNDSLLPILSDMCNTLANTTVNGKLLDNHLEFTTLQARIETLIG